MESVRQDICDEVESLLEKNRNLAKIHTRSKTLRNKAGWLASELETFSRNYLSVANNSAVVNSSLTSISSTS